MKRIVKLLGLVMIVAAVPFVQSCGDDDGGGGPTSVLVNFSSTSTSVSEGGDPVTLNLSLTRCANKL